MQQNYYKVLGLSKDCSANEIKKSYRKLALQYHPDKTMSQELTNEKFTQINQAYTILSDCEKRRIYDDMGVMGLNIQAEYTQINQRIGANLQSTQMFNGTNKTAFQYLADIMRDKDSDEDEEQDEEEEGEDQEHADEEHKINEGVQHSQKTPPNEECYEEIKEQQGEEGNKQEEQNKKLPKQQSQQQKQPQPQPQFQRQSQYQQQNQESHQQQQQSLPQQRGGFQYSYDYTKKTDYLGRIPEDMRDQFQEFARRANILSESDGEEQEDDFLKDFQPSFMKAQFNQFPMFNGQPSNIHQDSESADQFFNRVLGGQNKNTHMFEKEPSPDQTQKKKGQKKKKKGKSDPLMELKYEDMTFTKLEKQFGPNLSSTSMNDSNIEDMPFDQFADMVNKKLGGYDESYDDVKLPFSFGNDVDDEDDQYPFSYPGFSLGEQSKGIKKTEKKSKNGSTKTKKISKTDAKPN